MSDPAGTPCGGPNRSSGGLAIIELRVFAIVAEGGWFAKILAQVEDGAVRMASAGRLSETRALVREFPAYPTRLPGSERVPSGRHGVHVGRQEDRDTRGPKINEVADYWNQRERLVGILRFLGALERDASMLHWRRDAAAASTLGGAVWNDHV